MNQISMAADMPDCEGMSEADGQCNLKVICAAVPLLTKIVTYGLFPAASHVYRQNNVKLHPLWHARLERVPIFLT